MSDERMTCQACGKPLPQEGRGTADPGGLPEELLCWADDDEACFEELAGGRSVWQEVERLRSLEAIVKAALTCRGDDLCYRDVFNAEVAGLVGAEWKPEILDEATFVDRNCRMFYRCLVAGEHYVIPSVPRADYDRAIYLRDVALMIALGEIGVDAAADPDPRSAAIREVADVILEHPRFITGNPEAANSFRAAISEVLAAIGETPTQEVPRSGLQAVERQRNGAICFSVRVARNFLGLTEPDAIDRAGESCAAWMRWPDDPERDRIAGAVLAAAEAHRKRFEAIAAEATEPNG